jgi:hypothetical protein
VCVSQEGDLDDVIGTLLTHRGASGQEHPEVLADILSMSGK